MLTLLRKKNARQHKNKFSGNEEKRVQDEESNVYYHYYFITILYASSSSFHVPVYMYMPSTELILKRGLSKFYWHDMLNDNTDGDEDE